MGTDDLFKRKKQSALKSSKRRVELRESYDKVLIVTEGEKTEPLYLSAVCDYFGLNQANIEIDPKSDSSPTSVVKYAKSLINKNKIDPYNHVYCVIDRDTHQDFQQALDQVASFKNKDTKLHIILSVPCFEYWILLHFIYTAKPFGVSGDSPCQELIDSELKQYIAKYEKGNTSMLTNLVKGQLDIAIANAKRAYNEAIKRGTENPKTEIHILVEYLKNLKS